MNKYSVTYEYRGKVTVKVEADGVKEAEDKGLKEADFYAAGSLTVYDVKAVEIE